jgi:hypothetical protein
MEMSGSDEVGVPFEPHECTTGPAMKPPSSGGAVGRRSLKGVIHDPVDVNRGLDETLG